MSTNVATTEDNGSMFEILAQIVPALPYVLCVIAAIIVGVGIESHQRRGDKAGTFRLVYAGLAVAGLAAAACSVPIIIDNGRAWAAELSWIIDAPISPLLLGVFIAAFIIGAIVAVNLLLRTLAGWITKALFRASDNRARILPTE